MRQLKIFLFFLCAALSSAEDEIEGIWERSDKSAQIRVTVEGGELSFTLHSLAVKDRLYDSKNPDPSLRKRKLIGLKLAQGFKKEGEKWTGGTVYSSKSGKTYQGKIWLEGKDTLIMRGYKGVSLLGKSASWHRVK